ncbi:MAG: hypothetical protein R3A47_10110 [Polyangiales bacterium]
MRISRSLVVPLLVVAAITFTGCKAGQSDIESWGDTVKGPQKLAAVILSDRYSTELKTAAALTMVEMERQDVNGLTLLSDSLKQLGQSNAEELPKIIVGMMQPLQSLMQKKSDKENELLNESIRAKDAAFVLIPYADAAEKDSLTKSLIGWYAEDFAGRSLAGNYSADQVTRALGAPAAKQLVGALNDKMPEAALIKIAEVISGQGDAATKQAAAKRLVEIETKMESKEFLQWMNQLISAQYAAQSASGDEKPDAQRVAAVALAYREKRITDGVLPAMKYFAGEEAVQSRLMAIANTTPAASDSEAWKEIITARRSRALQALEGKATRKNLDALLQIALSSDNPISVRDDAFDRVGDIGSSDAIPRLWPLVQATGCTSTPCSASAELAQRLRWRAGELVLAIGGATIVRDVLNRLPAARGVYYEPGELAGYAMRMSQMTPPPTSVMRAEFGSADWWKRVIALRFIERRAMHPISSE